MPAHTLKTLTPSQVHSCSHSLVHFPHSVLSSTASSFGNFNGTRCSLKQDYTQEMLLTYSLTHHPQADWIVYDLLDLEVETYNTSSQRSSGTRHMTCLCLEVKASTNDSELSPHNPSKDLKLIFNTMKNKRW